MTREPPGVECKNARAQNSSLTMVTEQLSSMHWRCRRILVGEKTTHELGSQSRSQMLMTSCWCLSAGDDTLPSHPAVLHSLLANQYILLPNRNGFLQQSQAAVLHSLLCCRMLQSRHQVRDHAGGPQMPRRCLLKLVRRCLLKHIQATVLHSLLRHLIVRRRQVLETLKQSLRRCLLKLVRRCLLKQKQATVLHSLPDPWWTS